MENLKQFMTDDKGTIISVHDVNFDVNDVIGWISDHDQLYGDFKQRFDYVNEADVPKLFEVLDWLAEHSIAWSDFKNHFNIIEPGLVIDDGTELPESVVFEVTPFNLSEDVSEDELSDIVGDALTNRYGYCYLGYTLDVVRDEKGKPVLFICNNIEWDTSVEEDDDASVYDITYEDKNGERHNARITVPAFNSFNDEEVAFANAILELAKAEDVEKIIYLDSVCNEEDF